MVQEKVMKLGKVVVAAAEVMRSSDDKSWSFKLKMEPERGCRILKLGQSESKAEAWLSMLRAVDEAIDGGSLGQAEQEGSEGAG